MGANFFEGNNLKPFRFWCQKVLPIVYDDSLSYYELLSKLVDYVNKLIEDESELVEAYTKLQEYVNNYFEDLDVTAEINNKLDQMAQDGTLTALISRYTEETVNYLNGKLNEQNARLTAQDARLTEQDAYIEQIRGMVGSPRPAATVSAMTDHNNIYVYTGSESGYTSGNWYYWNGSAWTSGGVYNAVAVQTDTTLSVSGMAADAAATGLVKNQVDRIESGAPAALSAAFLANKAISSNGGIFDSNGRIATATFTPCSYSKRIEYKVDEGFRIYAATYAGLTESSKVNTYGWLTGSGAIDPASNERYFRVCIASVGDAVALTPADSYHAQITFWTQLNDDEYNGLTWRGNLTIGTNLDDITDCGIFNIGNNVAVTNIPSGFTGGTLFSFYGYSKLYENLRPNCMLQQMLISAYNKNIWIRFRSSAGTWNAWVAVGNLEIADKTKWLAMGDSLVYGVYSTGSDSTSITSTGDYTNLLAAGLGFDVRKMASRGMGYAVSGQDPENPSGSRIYLSDLLTRVEALTDDFNLVTLAFGINDYMIEATTLDQVIAGFDAAINRIVTKFPSARIVVITPFNCWRYGTADTNFSYRYETHGRSLQDVADAIKSRCEYFGVECLYLTNGFVFNNFNIQTLQLDKVHPTLTAHKLIAKTMAHYLFG